MKLVRLIVYLGMDTNGLLSFVMYIGVTVVITFIFFGQLLLHSGGSQFFNDISLALMGRYRGGAAKISVVASSLFGSISGIVVSNIVATGVITIALMKKSGFSPRLAAAIEATASTGGQLMPPVMGAVAFLMADFLARPYSDIVIAALVPSLLYYVALFIQADLEAAKAGIKRVEESEIPRLKSVLSTGWIFIIPFVVLVYVLFWMNRRAEEAAIYASISVLVLGLAFGYRGQRMKLRDVVKSLIATGIASLNILMIVAGAGFIIGTLHVTGLGFALTVFLVNLGAGNLIALLVIASLMCIVLGMGMPTLGVYILLAILIAPALVEVGVDPLAAHMFILYLGMMSFVTPPVAIGAFFAASLAGAEPMRTAFVSMRLGWAAYIVPFLFVFSPSLLLQGTSVLTTIVAVISAVAGVWLVSAGVTGFYRRRLPVPMRAGFVAAGALLLLPGEIGPWAVWTDPIGAVLGVLFVRYEISAGRRVKSLSAAAKATSSD
jgi:TRAP transporter 4TM/12TM fusion protein